MKTMWLSAAVASEMHCRRGTLLAGCGDFEEASKTWELKPTLPIDRLAIYMPVLPHVYSPVSQCVVCGCAVLIYLPVHPSLRAFSPLFRNEAAAYNLALARKPRITPSRKDNLANALECWTSTLRLSSGNQNTKYPGGAPLQARRKVTAAPPPAEKRKH